jgi:ATP/maltotriose-dependent transcriptional regulator MalT
VPEELDVTALPQSARRRERIGPSRPFSGVRSLMAGARGRANARLARAVTFPITVVSARPGYDRSIVVRDFLQAAELHYRLVEADLRDGGMLDFVRSLANAVRDAAPALASTFVAVYDRLGNAADASEQLAAWLTEHLKSVRLTLLIEAQGCPTDGRVIALLSSLIDRTHETIRWILSVESSELLPIARWLAQGRVDIPIDEADLAFMEEDLPSPGTCAAEGMSRHQLVKLRRATGGWPAAFALGIAAGPAIDLGAAPAEHTALYVHLAEAVLSTLSMQERAFIDTTCLFSSFDVALLECVGLFDVSRILAKLSDGIAILNEVREGSYQYDSIFRDFIRSRLRASGDAAFRAIAVRTANAYLRDGCFAEAIAIYAILGDFEAMGVLVSTHGFALMERGDSSTIQRTLELMPHDVIFGFPGALAVKASLESLHGNFDVAEAWFRLALDRIANEPQRAEIVYHFAMDLVRRERGDAIELLRPIVRGMSQEAALAAPLLGLLGTAYALDQQPAEAALAIDRALILLPRVTDPSGRAKILHQAAFVALRLSNIPTAKALALQAYGEAFACYNFDLAARALSIIYNIAIDVEDDIGTSIASLEQLASLSRRAGSGQLLLYATLCRYELEVFRGNALQIELLNEQLQSLDVFFSVLTTETLLPAQALQATWKGDFYRAYRLLQWSGEHQINPDRQAYRFAEIAVYAAAAGLREEASSAAERALAIARSLRSVDKTVLQTLSFVALTFVLLRRPARAAKLLAELSLRTQHSERTALVVRVIQRLAVRWIRSPLSSDFSADLELLERRDLGGLARMIEALPLPETVRSRSAQLTSLERDILTHLCLGFTSQKIALDTGRNVEKIDAQIRSLCRKLGCKDSVHAVAVTRSEGLLYDETDCARESA